MGSVIVSVLTVALFVAAPGTRWYSRQAPEVHGAPRTPLTMIGKWEQRYRIIETLGSGGMGIVYRAEDLALHRPVALKFLAPDVTLDDEARARFLREARVAASLNHPNTCTVYEVGEIGPASDWIAAGERIPTGTPFIAMELIEGETLAAKLLREGRLDFQEVLGIATALADGLAEAHLHRIVHRDLKPQNVMITRAGRLKILDFGLAKPLDRAHRTGVKVTTSEAISADFGHVNVVGTCGYMSPEQALGKSVDPRSDVFTFGIILYELVTGKRPFQADSVGAVLAKIIESPPEPLTPADGIPAELVRIIERCLQKKPEDRYTDARDLAAELGEARRQLAKREPHSDAGRWRFFRPRNVAAALAVLLLGGPLLYWLVADAPDGRQQTQRPEVPSVSSALPTNSAQSTQTAVQAPMNAALDRQDAQPRGTSKPPADLTGAKRDRQETPARGSAAPMEPRPPSVPPPAERGKLLVSSTPNASVFLDSTMMGLTPLALEIAPGTHELTLSTQDGLRWRGRVEIAAGQSSSVHRDLNALGSLTVVSEIWAEVSLDGGPSEQTPIHFPRVAAGLHEIRAFREGYVTQRREILVEEGKTVHLRLNMEKKQ